MTPPTNTIISDASVLAEELGRLRIIDPDRLAVSLAEFPGTSATAFADQLVSDGWLTLYQAERALAGFASRLVVGPYRITDAISDSGFGQLRTATDLTGTRRVRIRLFPLRSLWQARVAKKLVHAQSQLPAHPVLVPLAEVDTAHGRHYLVWPHMDGERLDARVRASGPLPPAETALLLRRLAEGLSHCHRRGTEHGMLHPGTVLLGSDGQPRLLDLGAGPLFAQNLAEAETLFDSFSESVLCSELLAVVAPEVLAEPASLSPVADQYGLGVVAYFALTGLLPFEEPDLLHTIAVRQSPAPPLRDLDSTLPGELASIVDRMLATDPTDRFLSMDEVIQALTDYLVKAGIEAPASDATAEPDAPASLDPESHRSGSGSFSSSSHGSVSWTGMGAVGSVMMPVERDGSDDSIQFDLPPTPAEELPIPHHRVAVTPGPRVVPEPQTPLSATNPPAEPDQSLLETHLAGAGFGGPTPSPDRPRRPLTPDSPGRSLLLSSIATNDEVPLPTLPTANATEPAASETGLKPRGKFDSGSGFRAILGRPTPSPSPDAEPKSVLWKSVKRNVLFWQSSADELQVSLFGPASLVPGSTVELELFLHTPASFDNVRTISRAFLRDSELLGTGKLAQEVKRESNLAVHIALANAGLSQSMMGVVWRGQPQRMQLTVHIPWESPAGLSPGIISVGKDNVRIGRIDFQVSIQPRTSA